MTAAGWVVAVDKLIETGQIFIGDCDANFAVGMIVSFSAAIAKYRIHYSCFQSEDQLHLQCSSSSSSK